jgi:hypothetical protein
VTITASLLLVIAALQAAILVCGVITLRRRAVEERRSANQLAVFVDVIERALHLEPGRISQDMAMIAVGQSEQKPKRSTKPPRDIERERREAIQYAALRGEPIPVFPPAGMNRRGTGPLEEDAMPLGTAGGRP